MLLLTKCSGSLCLFTRQQIRVRLVSLTHQSYMACIRPSYCYARQKFGLSISALNSQSNAVGSRKMNQCDVPNTFLTPCFLLMVTSFFYLFAVFLNFSFLSRQFSRVMRAVARLHGCIFFKSQNKQHAYLLHLRKMLNVCFI